jgi:hypothetical protein
LTLGPDPWFQAGDLLTGPPCLIVYTVPSGQKSLALG